MSTFEAKVRRTIEQLQHDGFEAMAASITAKRLNWLDRNLAGENAHYTPREAYELLFFRQMGLERDELPVVLETENEIVWLSTNRCSLLEACVALGLDTRRVCRQVNEKATQAFLSRLDPRLRFHRSYVEIRPTAGYCREKIVRIDFEAYMRVAIQEAQRARSEGNRGHGAVVVFEDRIVGQAHDTSIAERDPGLHAGAKAIRQAVKRLGDPDLCGTILFATCEPCPMCTFLAVETNVTTIVYGVSIAEVIGLGETRIRASAQHIAEQTPRVIDVIGGILYDECKALYAW